jgi:hypothetical protein
MKLINTSSNNDTTDCKMIQQHLNTLDDKHHEMFIRMYMLSYRYDVKIVDGDIIVCDKAA